MFIVDDFDHVFIADLHWTKSCAAFRDSLTAYPIVCTTCVSAMLVKCIVIINYAQRISGIHTEHSFTIERIYFSEMKWNSYDIRVRNVKMVFCCLACVNVMLLFFSIQKKPNPLMLQVFHFIRSLFKIVENDAQNVQSQYTICIQFNSFQFHYYGSCSGGWECGSPVTRTRLFAPIRMVYALVLHLNRSCFRQYQYVWPVRRRSRCFRNSYPPWIRFTLFFLLSTNVASSVKSDLMNRRKSGEKILWSVEIKLDFRI